MDKVKCRNCLFAKEIDSNICKCLNSMSGWCGMRLFLKYDGCNDGKQSTFGMTKNELLRLKVDLKESEE